MTDVFPLPRQMRESDILVGNGAVTYGPFAFSIFDIEDVSVIVSRGGTSFQKEIAVVRKTTAAPFSPFTVSFTPELGPSDRFQVIGQRLHARSTDVLRGGAINSNGLENELSAQAVVLQELRRDNSRITEFSFGFIKEGEVLLAEMREVRVEVEADKIATGLDVITTAAAVAEAHSVLEQATAGFTGFPAGSAFDFGSVADPFVFFPQNWGTL